MKVNAIFLLALVLAILTACGGSSSKETNSEATDNASANTIQRSTAPAPEFLISCNGVGNILFSYNYTRLKELFGNKVSEIQDGHDGEYCTVSFPDGVSADVYFDFERAQGERISFISIGGPEWKLSNGIHPGMKVEDAAAIIGKPLNCFFNEEVAVVYLDPKELLPCVTAMIANNAQPEQHISELLPQPLKTAGMDKGFSSDEEGFRKLKPTIMYIEVFNPVK